jgi:hypothetical protein
MGWVVNATPRPFCPPVKRPGTHSTIGWVGPTPGLAGVVNLAPSVFERRDVHPVASPNTDYANPAPKLLNIHVHAGD